VRDGKEVYKFPSLDPARGAWVTLSRDGQTAVVYLEAGYQRAESGRQQVWRLAGPKPTLLLDLPPDCRSWQDTALSPDSRFYLYRTPSAPLLRCELATGRTQALPASDGTIRALAFHPDSQHVAVGLEQNNTWRLEVRTMDDARPTVTVALPVPVLTLNWNPDGRQVIATTRDEKLYTCDTVRGVLRIYEGIKNNGVALEFGRRGNVFVTNGWEHKLRLWNARTGGQILSLPLQADFPMRFAADGRNLLGQQNEPVYPLHEIADGWECRILGGPPFGSLKGGWLSGNQAIRGDGRLAGVSMGWHVNRVCLWDLDAGEEVANLATGLGTAAIFDADGALLTLGPSGLHRWPIHLPDPSGTPGPHPWRVGPPEVLLKGDFGRGAIARSRDGQVLALGAFGTSRPLILHRGAGEPIVLGPQPNVRQIAVSPDGRWVATGSWNGTDAGVFVWDAATGRKVQVLPAVDTGSVDFSGDGQWLVTGKRDSRLWQVGSWQPGVTLGGSGNFTFSPDGSLLAEAQFEPYVRLRDPETGRTLARLDDPSQNRASRLAFSPDGTRLAYVGDESYALHVWDLRLIRRQLALRGLDWDRPAYAAAPDSERAVAPILIEVEGSKR
jgi:WD40 repeat protein